MARAYCAQCGAEVPVEGGVCFFGHAVETAEGPAAASAEWEPSPESGPGPAPTTSEDEAPPGSEAPPVDGVDVSALESAIAELEGRDPDVGRPEQGPAVTPETHASPDTASPEPATPDTATPDTASADAAYLEPVSEPDGSRAEAISEDAFAPGDDDDYSLAWEQEIGEPEPATQAEPVYEPEPAVEAEPEPTVEPEPAVEAEPEPTVESEPVAEDTADEDGAISYREELAAAAAAAAASSEEVPDGAEEPEGRIEIAEEPEGALEIAAEPEESLAAEDPATVPTEPAATETATADEPDFVWEQEITGRDTEPAAPSRSPAPTPAEEPANEAPVAPPAPDREEAPAEARDAWDLTDWDLGATLDGATVEDDAETEAPGLATAWAPDEESEPEPEAPDADDEVRDEEPPRAEGRRGAEIDPANFTARRRGGRRGRRRRG